MAALIRWVLFTVELTFVPGVQLAHVGDAQLGSLVCRGHLYTIVRLYGTIRPQAIAPSSPDTGDHN
ncbi:hypothetical protein HaLaN_21536 [Haematococcus lacustris]|uniref:Secreted protein n=1 Tax=Haematococcus lacustris TaxID=44745 RepID=A0A699ZZF9_HAELA|nr:hypothetical protein HaLaN_21536 [Haematococcus lacustris]